jgi:hypothetical protein
MDSDGVCIKRTLNFKVCLAYHVALQISPQHQTLRKSQLLNMALNHRMLMDAQRRGYMFTDKFIRIAA